MRCTSTTLRLTDRAQAEYLKKGTQLHLCDALQLPCDPERPTSGKSDRPVASMRCTSTTLRRQKDSVLAWSNYMLHLCDALQLPCDANVRRLTCLRLRLHLCDALQLPCDRIILLMLNTSSVASMRCTSTTLRLRSL